MSLRYPDLAAVRPGGLKGAFARISASLRAATVPVGAGRMIRPAILSMNIPEPNGVEGLNKLPSLWPNFF